MYPFRALRGCNVFWRCSFSKSTETRNGNEFCGKKGLEREDINQPLEDEEETKKIEEKSGKE
jgi:hypothetical protein